jgi:hypothetical protein
MNAATKKVCQVRVFWLPPEKGGRQHPIVAGRYVAPASFDGTLETANWSLVLELGPRNEETLESTGTGCFLFPEAPHDVLTPGAKFKMYEGPKLVLEGVVE